jgi:hypothetical protein
MASCGCSLYLSELGKTHKGRDKNRGMQDQGCDQALAQSLVYGLRLLFKVARFTRPIFR